MNSSPRIDNKRKDILLLGKGPTPGLGEHLLTAEKMCSSNFTKKNTKLCLSFHYNGRNSYFFVNSTDTIKFKTIDSEIVSTPLCLGNISKEFSKNITKKTGLNRYFYGFSVDYDAVGVADMLDIHKYLMKKNRVV